MTQRISTTYQASFPKASHWRSATCAEVDCPQYLMGWVTKVIVGSDMEGYIKADRTRKYKVVNQGEINEYYFEAGQQCFRGEAGVHYKKLERGAWLTKDATNRHPLFLERIAMEPEKWMDEFNEDAYKLRR
jgi:hypothetical protein